MTRRLFRAASPSLPVLMALQDTVRLADGIDPLLAAQLTAHLAAPVGSFVTISPTTARIRVCVGYRPFTKADDVWRDWPAWRARWAVGPIDAAAALIRLHVPETWAWSVDSWGSATVGPHRAISRFYAAELPEIALVDGLLTALIDGVSSGRGLQP